MGVKRENIKQFFNLAIPSNWEIISIGYLCTIYVGRDLKESSYSKNKSDEFRYPVYSNTVEKEGLYGYYNYKEFTGDSLTIVGRGAGLGTAFTRRGSYGAIGRLLVLFPNENVSAHYITEYVNNKINIHQESGGIPQLTGQQIARYKISIPKYSEQKTIAKALGLMDKAIISNNKLIAQKELRKKWLMQNLLSGKKRLKGFSGEWEEVKLNQVCKISKGKQLNKIELTKSGSFPSFSGGINPSGYTEKWNTEENTIILSEGGDSCGFVNFVTSKFWSGGHCYALLDLSKDVNKEFLFQNLKFNQSRIMRLRVGSGLPNIQKKDIDKFSFIIPPYKEQIAIAQILMAIDKELNLLKVKTEKLKEQKKGMMQVLLTGEKRLNLDLED